MARRRVEAFRSRGLLFFSGDWILMQLLSLSTSIHLIAQASPGLAAVSLMSCVNAALFGSSPLISWSTSISVGMKGNVSILRHLGLFHLMPFQLWKRATCSSTVCFRFSVTFGEATYALTVSGLRRFVRLARALRALVAEFTVLHL